MSWGQERSCRAAPEPAKEAGGSQEWCTGGLLPSTEHWGHRTEREMALMSPLGKTKVASDDPSSPLLHPSEAKGTPRAEPARGMGESRGSLHPASAGRCGNAFLAGNFIPLGITTPANKQHRSCLSTSKGSSKMNPDLSLPDGFSPGNCSLQMSYSRVFPKPQLPKQSDSLGSISCHIPKNKKSAKSPG